MYRVAFLQPYSEPREMTVDEIKTCVEQFRQGALNCMEAGFDAIEVRISPHDLAPLRRCSGEGGDGGGELFQEP